MVGTTILLGRKRKEKKARPQSRSTPGSAGEGSRDDLGI